MSCRRTLVITLGQLRAHRLTWTKFKENVLEQLDADLAICCRINDDFDFTNPFYTNARFRWLVPEAADLADTIDLIQQQLGSTEDWRVLCDVGGHWLGGVLQSNQSTGQVIPLVLRWFMLDNIQAAKLTEIYDRFIITRSDYYFLRPHPPLDCLNVNYLWIPDGEDYGGLCDRHLVVSARDLVSSCNMIEDLLRWPVNIRKDMIAADTYWNIEKVIWLHFKRNGLIAKVRRFPLVMFLVKDSDDTISGTSAYFPDVGMEIRHRSEVLEAMRYKEIICSNDDWYLSMAAQFFESRLPARVYTIHGTALYVDELTGEVRHGPLSEVPKNVFLTGEQGGARLIHRTHDLDSDVVFRSEQGISSYYVKEKAASLSPSIFTRVPVKLHYSNRFSGLQSGNLYLSAEPNGRVVLNRNHCSLWEFFRLITYAE